MAAIVDPGDEVILHEPSYVAYLPAILFNGGVPGIRVDDRRTDFALDAGAVRRRHAAHKVLFLGYPCNPTGAVLDAETLPRWRISPTRHDLLVVSDEIYDRLVYGGHRHTPIAALAGMRDRTITDRRLLEGVRHDRLARRLRVRAAGSCSKASSRFTSTRSCPRRPTAQDARRRRAQRARAGRRADGRRVRPPPAHVR